MLRTPILVVAMSAVASVVGCGLFLDYSDYQPAQDQNASSSAAQSGGGIGGGQGGAAGATSSGGSTNNAGGSSSSGATGGSMSCGTNGQCVPLPAGWQGPFSALIESASATEQVACNSGVTTFYTVDTVWPASTCKTCSCVNECEAEIDGYTASSCAGTAGTSVFITTTGCSVLNGTGGPVAKVSAGMAFAAQVCTGNPSGTETLKPPATAGNRIVLCGDNQDPPGCASGTACAEPPSNPYTAVCIASAVVQPCPNGFNKYDVETITADSRACGDCTCTGTGTCNASVTLESDWSPTGGCSGTVYGTLTSGQCINFATDSDTIGIVVNQLQPGSCGKAAGAGAPTGQVATTPAGTVCCTMP